MRTLSRGPELHLTNRSITHATGTHEPRQSEGTGPNASRRQRGHKGGGQDLDRVVNGLTDLGWPLLCNLGFSGAVGFCTGVATKVHCSLGAPGSLRRGSLHQDGAHGG